MKNSYSQPMEWLDKSHRIKDDETRRHHRHLLKDYVHVQTAGAAVAQDGNIDMKAGNHPPTACLLCPQICNTFNGNMTVLTSFSTSVGRITQKKPNQFSRIFENGMQPSTVKEMTGFLELDPGYIVDAINISISNKSHHVALSWRCKPSECF